ncbi:hypothetical protein BDQ17DRAFT_1332914 [Cyathus striatus]|nr:hypothetical protein BDQ17DRAFT_1332914 [Cyathus striatus]
MSSYEESKMERGQLCEADCELDDAAYQDGVATCVGEGVDEFDDALNDDILGEAKGNILSRTSENQHDHAPNPSPAAIEPVVNIAGAIESDDVVNKTAVAFKHEENLGKDGTASHHRINRHHFNRNDVTNL